MRDALGCTKQLQIETIAFPGIGTGVGGLSLKEAARTMVSEIRKHVDGGTSLNQTVLIGFTKNLTCEFEKAIGEIIR